MAQIKSMFFVLLCGKTFIGVNSVSNISPESVLSCDDNPNAISLTNKGEGEDKSWTGEVNVPFEIDSNTEFTMDFRWYKNDELEKTGKILKGKACFYIEKFCSSLWKQIKKAANPPIDGDCIVKPGKYQFVDFVPQLQDMFIPIGGSGKANAKVTMTKNESVFCFVVIAYLK